MGGQRQVLLVHGAPGDARLWGPVIEALPGDIDARALTLSYFGTADWPGDGSDFGTHLHKDDIVSFVESRMDRPVTLAAWSFGCHPALLAVLERPDLFEALVLYEPGFATYVEDTDGLADFAADCEAAFPPVGEAMQAGQPGRALEIIFDNAAQAGDFAALPQARRDLYADSLRVLPLIMGGGQPPAEITSADLAKIACPVTVAYGEHTRPMFSVPSKAVAAAVPGAKLVEVPGAYHMMPETDPVGFGALLGRLVTVSQEGTV
ncbi:MAG: alpha/beta hydrolase [Novosphingobium sp.]|nr:alpha/beta hydrolase [Novosphingobium sp.]